MSLQQHKGTPINVGIYQPKEEGTAYFTLKNLVQGRSEKGSQEHNRKISYTNAQIALEKAGFIIDNSSVPYTPMVSIPKEIIMVNGLRGEAVIPVNERNAEIILGMYFNDEADKVTANIDKDATVMLKRFISPEFKEGIKANTTDTLKYDPTKKYQIPEKYRELARKEAKKKPSLDQVNSQELEYLLWEP